VEAKMKFDLNNFLRCCSAVYGFNHVRIGFAYREGDRLWAGQEGGIDNGGV